MITIFTDGSSRGNPGPGGWGAIVATGTATAGGSTGQVNELGGREEHTTNNRMELRAVVEALNFVANPKNAGGMGGEISAIIYTDSSYVKRGATQWLARWQASGWRSTTKKDILNRDLWEALAAAMAAVEARGVQIAWKLLGGHIGIPGNERCDEIATGFATGERVELFAGQRASYSVAIDNISSDAFLKKEKSSSRAHSRAAAYSYVSMVGGVIQTHKTWAECEKRVKGVPGGVRFKKATSAADEAAIIADFKSKK